MYEITLQESPPASLVARFPAITCYSAPVTTILSRRVIDSAELDGLIERLRSLGITPLEVRNCSGDYEVRIEGQLGDSTLRYLRWPARLDQERVVLCVFGAAADLQLILDELASSGIGIDHFLRRSAA